MLRPTHVLDIGALTHVVAHKGTKDVKGRNIQTRAHA